MTRIAVTGLLVLVRLAAGSAGALEITPPAWATGDWIEAALAGSPIAAPDSISLLGPSGEVIRADRVAPTGERITFRIDLRQAPLGWYDLRLATQAGDAHTEPHCFEVLALAPPEAWLEPHRVTEEPETSDRPKVAVDRDGQVHVVWQNLQPGSSDRFHILYRRWTGSVWTDIEYLTSGG